jgi:putative inorganic carbon (HCO3(-)) transporter
MLQSIRSNSLIIVSAFIFIALSIFFIWNEQPYLTLFPFVLLAIYFCIYETKWAFLGMAFFTPLSVNIEEWTNSFGLFVPTEPVLFGFMILIIAISLKKNSINTEFWKNPIIWAIGLYLFWIGITCITSTNPMVSIKFLIARLWFIIPLLVFGTIIFMESKFVKWFLWLFISGMVIVMLYTLTTHASYRFGEKESHWVMWPFFKDHTIYGAIVALIVPLLFGLYFSKKHPPLVQAVVLGFIFINLLALYFSYTRAAWLSIFAAIGVWALIHFKIRFSILLGTALFSGTVLWYSWDAIQMELERNKFEHTTEEFSERLQSATNVTTDASNLERINRWSCAIGMFKERPVFGFGPGTYAFEYARFQEPENLTIISTNFGNMGNAHSEYLGPLAEMGFIGLLTILIVIAMVYYKSITLYYAWPENDRENRIIILAIILSLTTYFVHGILNNFLDTDKAAVPIWGMVAIIMAMEIRLKNKKVTV